MLEVATVTDSTSCLPEKLIKEYSIEIVPVTFTHAGKVYRDGIDITPSKFYELLAKAEVIPVTSPSSPGTYMELFRKLGQKVNSILVITPSIKFSQMFNSARIAAEMAKETLKGVTIEVLDSQTAAGAQGFVVLAAAKAAALGKNLGQVIQAAREMMSRVHLFAFIDTLHYLAKGGRVPQVAAFASSLLKIKPLFALLPLEGEAKPLGSVRTRSKAIEHLLSLVKKKVGRKPVHFLVMHTNVPKEAEALKERLLSDLKCLEIYVSDFTPTMGVHTGPGVLAIAFYSEDE